MMWIISETLNVRAFKHFAIVFSIPENLLIGISGSVRRKVSHSICKHMFCENAVGYLRNGECKSFQTFAIVFSTSENWLVGISGGLRNEQKATFSCKKVFWENAVGYLRYSEC